MLSERKYDSPVISPRLGIVIPCFNEAGNLLRLISECEIIVEDGTYQFVLVNNGSTDQTSLILSSIKNRNIKVLNLDNNKGYGGGILEGLRILDTQFVGWIHADLQTDLQQSLNAARHLDFDYFKGIRTGRSMMERLFSVGMGVFCSILFRTKLYEINAQPTIMKRSLYESWKYPPTDFSLDLYSLVIAKQAKVNVVRSKFFFGKRSHGQSSWNFGFRSQVRMISRTIRYALSLYHGGTQ